MSVIAGLARFDGGPIDRLPLERMAARIANRAVDGVTIHNAGSAGFVIGRIDSTTTAAAQPVTHAPSAVTLAFDGRLDNRAELLSQLGLANDTSDGGVALAAHLKWPDSAAEHLEGDFAVAAWHAGDRRLTAYRDCAGVAPFFYRVGSGWIAWASALDVLAGALDPRPELNEGMIAELLAAYIVDRRETVYRDIFRLPAAHTLSANDGGACIRRHWRPAPRSLNYASDAEYDEHLHDLLPRVVGARMRTRGPSAILLSGGVDSSTVSAIAANLQRSGAVAATGVETFSMRMPGSSDESAFFNEAARHLDVPSHVLPYAPPLPGQYQAEAAETLEPPAFSTTPMLGLFCAGVRARGARVLLTGMGGDDWLGTSTWGCADLFVTGRWRQLAQRLRHDELLRGPGGLRLALQGTLFPILPAPIVGTIRTLLGRGQPPPWIEPAFADRVSLRDRMAARDPDVGFRSHESEDTWRCGSSGVIADSLERSARAVSQHGLDCWHPLFDRKIIEFGLALPAEQRWRDGRAKEVLRRTMSAELPATVWRRSTSPGAEHTFVDAIAAEGGSRLVEFCESERRGWIRGDVVRNMFQELITKHRAGDAGYAKPGMIVWSIIAVNLWLAALDMVKYPPDLPEGQSRA